VLNISRGLLTATALRLDILGIKLLKQELALIGENYYLVNIFKILL